MQELFKQYYRTNEAQKQINVERARIQKDNNERLARIRELEENLGNLRKQLEDPTINDSKKQTLFKEWQMQQQEGIALDRERREFLQRRNQALNEKMVQRMKGILEEIRKLVEEQAKVDNYDYVFDKSGLSTSQVPFLLYTKDATDITAGLLKDLNKDAPEESLPAEGDEEPGNPGSRRPTGVIIQSLPSWQSPSRFPSSPNGSMAHRPGRARFVSDRHGRARRRRPAGRQFPRQREIPRPVPPKPGPARCSCRRVTTGGPEGAALIAVDNPTLAFSVVVRHFAAATRNFTPGVIPRLRWIRPRPRSRKKSGPSRCRGYGGRLVGDGSEIGPNAWSASNAVIGRDCHLMANSTVRERCVLGDRVILQPGAVIGSDGYGYEFSGGRHVKIDQVGIVEIGDDVEIGANTTIDRARFGKTVVGEGTKIDNLVQIGHNCVIGKHCLIVALCGISGSTRIRRLRHDGRPGRHGRPHHDRRQGHHHRPRRRHHQPSRRRDLLRPPPSRSARK
jgi:outer membrane protein